MLDKSLQFLKLIRNLELVERAVIRPSDKKENDVEHSYQVAMMAWFLASQFRLNLSIEKLLKYALLHDLVEVYAGDTPAFHNQTANTHETQREREKMALIKIEKEFSNFPEMTGTIKSYESKKDEESIFVYEIDKIIPALNLYLDGGYGWNKLGLKLEEIKREKRAKVRHTKQLVDLLEETLEVFEKEQERLFEFR